VLLPVGASDTYAVAPGAGSISALTKYGRTASNKRTAGFTRSSSMLGARLGVGSKQG
jgi:hypothetical protein